MFINIVKFATQPGNSSEGMAKIYERELESQRNYPGLINAYFIHGSDIGGVIYRWHSRSGAELFFSPEWLDNFEKLCGEKLKIDWFENSFH